MAAPDASSGKALVWRLALQRSIASLDADNHHVQVRALGDTPTVSQVLETVEGWLHDAGIDSVSVWFGGAEHTLERRPV